MAKPPDCNNPPPSTPAPATTLANTPAEAEKRYSQWKKLDPFPAIQPALLNSADVLAYVKATSLIYPFDTAKLKGASYDVTIEGEVVYYDAECKDPSKRRKSHNLLNEGDYFDLLPNSIAFVTLKPMFRIPYYMALRFNLKISHIYKGLLLGTGPLVDPGFSGRLSIPLHNLTNNTYRFHKGDELITMEFTKMSPNKLWEASTPPLGHSDTYIPNDIKSDRKVLEYIAKALNKDGLNEVISSIPSAMQDSKSAAAAAQKSAEMLEKKATLQAGIQAGISIIAVCSLVLSTIGATFNAINKANDRYDAIQAENKAIIEEYSDKIDDLTQEIQDLQIIIDNLTSNATTPTDPSVPVVP